MSNNTSYDLDTSKGLMLKVQELIAPPKENEEEKKSKRKGGLDLHPYYKRPGKGHNRDTCDSCGDGGDLLCCDRCPASFHFKCIYPPIHDVKELPLGGWLCNKCTHLVKKEATKELSKGKGKGKGKGKALKTETETETETLTLTQRELRAKERNEKNNVSAEALTLRHAFKVLTTQAEEDNPKEFSLPYELQDKTVLPGDDKIVPAKVSSRRTSVSKKKPYELDNNGNVTLPAVLCFFCGKSCRVQKLIPCDFCPLCFHLDCLNPPLTCKPDKVWMCPAHVYHFVEKYLLTSDRFTERKKLFERFASQKLDHATIATDFLRTVRRQFHSASRFRVNSTPRNAVQVPENVVDGYVNRVALQPEIQDLCRVPPPPLMHQRKYCTCRLRSCMCYYNLHRAPNTTDRETRTTENDGTVNEPTCIERTLSQCTVNEPSVNKCTLNETTVNEPTVEVESFRHLIRKEVQEMVPENVIAGYKNRVALQPQIQGLCRVPPPSMRQRKRCTCRLRSCICYYNLDRTPNDNTTDCETRMTESELTVNEPTVNETTVNETTVNEPTVEVKSFRHLIKKEDQEMLFSAIIKMHVDYAREFGVIGSINQDIDEKPQSPKEDSEIKNDLMEVDSEPDHSAVECNSELMNGDEPVKSKQIKYTHNGEGQNGHIGSEIGENSSNDVAGEPKDCPSTCDCSLHKQLTKIKTECGKPKSKDLSFLSNDMIMELAYQRLQQIVADDSNKIVDSNRIASVTKNSQSLELTEEEKNLIATLKDVERKLIDEIKEADDQFFIRDDSQVVIEKPLPGVEEQICEVMKPLDRGIYVFLVPVDNSTGPIYPFGRGGCIIGSGYSSETDLKLYGHCENISDLHATIHFNSIAQRYEIMNYSSRGTYVNNIKLGMDFSRVLEHPGNANVIQPVNQMIAQRRHEIEEFYRRGAPMINQVDRRPLQEQRRCVCGEAGDLDAPGWEGIVAVSHGALLKFGCLEFIFLILEKMDLPPISLPSIPEESSRPSTSGN